MEQDFLEEIKGRDIDLIVVSDGEAILGIGGMSPINPSTAALNDIPLLQIKVSE